MKLDLVYSGDYNLLPGSVKDTFEVGDRDVADTDGFETSGVWTFSLFLFVEGFDGTPGVQPIFGFVCYFDFSKIYSQRSGWVRSGISYLPGSSSSFMGAGQCINP